VGVNHRGAHISVPKQLLDGSDIVAVLKQMRRKRMAKRVRACRLDDTGLLHSLFYHLLQYGLVQMVPSSLSRYLADGCSILERVRWILEATCLHG
jgi:predicted protein tyrosine phosphatase